MWNEECFCHRTRTKNVNIMRLKNFEVKFKLLFLNALRYDVISMLVYRITYFRGFNCLVASFPESNSKYSFSILNQ